MQTREADVFTVIVKEYIKTALPVSSKMVLEKSGLAVSSATIRAIMAKLEDQGFIVQPHTSAGRIPTQVGYDFYIEKFLNEKILDERLCVALRNLFLSHGKTEEYSIKVLAKAISELSKLLVFVAFDHNDVYYTGISMLFSQPEFTSPDRVYDISRVVDHMDEVIEGLFGTFAGSEVDVAILVGDRNPFHKESSVIIAPCICHERFGLIGLIGPIRMDYEINLALMKYAVGLLKK